MHPHRTHPNRRQAMLTLIATTLLPACGGGGTEIAGVSTGGTGSFTNGVIVGLGSVIVNGIRYDDTVAQVTIDGIPSSPSALQLGMVVRIQGSAVTPATTPGGLATAKATRIAYASEWKGQASLVNVGGGTFALLGQTVRVLGTTIFSEGVFDGSLEGRYVEVYGFINANDGSLQASRIEIKSSAPERLRLSGIVTGLTHNTFLLGSALINHASASQTNGLQNGQLVRVELLSTPQDGSWIGTEIKTDNDSSALEDDDEAEIEGAITAFTSTTRFNVNGIAVNASRITPPNGLALGVRVEVKGAISGGVVIATQIEVKSDEEVEAQPFKFHGAISALDTANKTFQVRGYAVRYGAQTVFDFSQAIWANGLNVEVKAVLDHTGQLLATEIEEEH